MHDAAHVCTNYVLIASGGACSISIIGELTTPRPPGAITCSKLHPLDFSAHSVKHSGKVQLRPPAGCSHASSSYAAEACDLCACEPARDKAFGETHSDRCLNKRPLDQPPVRKAVRRATSAGCRIGILSLALWWFSPPIAPAFGTDYPVNEDSVTINAASMKGDAVDFVIAPIPIANPTVGNGLAVAGLLLYKIDPESPASSTALAAGYTDSDSWGVGFLQEANFARDTWRFSGGLAVALARYDLYVPEVSPDFYFTTEQRLSGGMAQILRSVTSRLYAGLRFQRARVVFPGENVPQELIPEEGLTLDIGGLGVIAEWDSRDNGYQPSAGSYVSLRSNFARDTFGSDMSYDTYGLAVNHFRRGFRAQDVLAMRTSLCAASNDTPFFERCQFGSANDLRGYAVGRYYDDAMYAVQVEYRAPLWKRLGGVVFAGIGAVASSFSKLDTAKSLSAAGVGLRYLASPEQRVNVSVDFAYGRDESALYVYIGEAF